MLILLAWVGVLERNSFYIILHMRIQHNTSYEISTSKNI